MRKNTLLLIGILSLYGCSSLNQPAKVADSIPLYENQPEVLNGVYFNQPYSYTYDYKTLLDFFEINNHNVDSVQLALVGPERLKVTSYKALGTETNFIEGKVVNGTFEIEKNTFWFGVPFLLFVNSKENIRICAGVMDELIIQHYQYKTGHFFGSTSDEEFTNFYHYSKTLDVIP